MKIENWREKVANKLEDKSADSCSNQSCLVTFPFHLLPFYLKIIWKIIFKNKFLSFIWTGTFKGYTLRVWLTIFQAYD